MLRMRVYRLSLSITLMGLELWALGIVAGGAIVSLQFYSKILPSILPFPVGAATGFGLLKIVTTLKRYFPGRAFAHLMHWIAQGDRYAIRREKRCLPLIVPDEQAPPNQQPPTKKPRTVLKPLVYAKE